MNRHAVILAACLLPQAAAQAADWEIQVGGYVDRMFTGDTIPVEPNSTLFEASGPGTEMDITLLHVLDNGIGPFDDLGLPSEQLADRKDEFAFRRMRILAAASAERDGVESASIDETFTFAASAAFGPSFLEITFAGRGNAAGRAFGVGQFGVNLAGGAAPVEGSLVYDSPRFAALELFPQPIDTPQNFEDAFSALLPVPDTVPFSFGINWIADGELGDRLGAGDLGPVDVDPLEFAITTRYFVPLGGSVSVQIDLGANAGSSAAMELALVVADLTAVPVPAPLLPFTAAIVLLANRKRVLRAV